VGTLLLPAPKTRLSLRSAEQDSPPLQSTGPTSRKLRGRLRVSISLLVSLTPQGCWSHDARHFQHQSLAPLIFSMPHYPARACRALLHDRTPCPAMSVSRSWVSRITRLHEAALAPHGTAGPRAHVLTASISRRSSAHFSPAEPHNQPLGRHIPSRPSPVGARPRSAATQMEESDIGHRML